ncbi:uncharacterized protein LOC109793735 [Cajanus cajan]|uniref:uncharacterized protein LOC109793735 n=1 Tax=Cajanus cajan TaxID=3821 RepID=UPI00098D7FEB|nr:uncharacterized protein LOC109793735 [Cajanus cajan]
MALKPRPFADSLCHESPRDMDELCAHAVGYIQMEEHSAFRNQIRGKGPMKPEQGHKDKIRVNTDSQVHILEEASDSNLLALPPPGHTPNSADKSKHCQYHRNHGHTTEECRTLRDRIEELIQSSHLGHYVQQSHQGSYDGPRRDRGHGSGARTNQPSGSQLNPGRAVQAESLPMITFTDKDYAEVNPNQDDPMVIAVELANWEVHKTLIDQQSSADVLY